MPLERNEVIGTPQLITVDEVLDPLSDLFRDVSEEEFDVSGVEATIMDNLQMILAGLREKGTKVLPENVEIISVNDDNYTEVFTRSMRILTHPKQFGNFTIQLQLNLEGVREKKRESIRESLLLKLLRKLGFAVTDVKENKLLILISEN